MDASELMSCIAISATRIYPHCEPLFLSGLPLPLHPTGIVSAQLFPGTVFALPPSVHQQLRSILTQWIAHFLEYVCVVPAINCCFGLTVSRDS